MTVPSAPPQASDPAVRVGTCALQEAILRGAASCQVLHPRAALQVVLRALQDHRLTHLDMGVPGLGRGQDAWEGVKA